MTLSPKQVGAVLGLSNLPISGPFAVVGPIEKYRALVFNQTTANVSASMPNARDTSVVFGVDIINSGTVAININGARVNAGATMRAVYKGGWIVEPSVPSLTGATPTIAGSPGIAPTPVAGDQAKFLQGDATWTTIIPVFSSTVSYPQGQLVRLNGKVYSANSVIVTGTSFLEGTGPGTWTQVVGEKKVSTNTSLSLAGLDMDVFVSVSATANTTITLPAVVAAKGLSVTVCNANTSGYYVTLSTAGGNLLTASSWSVNTLRLNHGETVSLVSDGTYWVQRSASARRSLKTLPNVIANGPLCSVDDVDANRILYLPQTAAGVSLVVPVPSNPPFAEFGLTVRNTGVVPFTILNNVIPVSGSITMSFIAGAWTVTSTSGPRWARFTGNGAFTAPSSVLYITGCGGGAGGGAGGSGPASGTFGCTGGGGGGGAGGLSIKVAVGAAVGTSYVVTVGTPGAGGSPVGGGNGGGGTNGSTSSVGAIWSANGGAAGGGGKGGAGVGPGGTSGNGGLAATNTMFGASASDGADAGAVAVPTGQGGAGAGSPFGGGGGGGRAGAPTGYDGKGSSGYGAGGGGGGGSYNLNSGNGGSGGAGTAGFILIEW